VIVFPYNDIERTLAILDAQASEIAAVLIDPVPHRVGLVPGSPVFVEAVYQWTRRNGALLIFDEVVTFRIKYGGAQQGYTHKPDLTALGKIIGGGFPVGAVTGRADVMRVLDPSAEKILFPHSGTFSANPITLTAGFVAMQHFDQAAVSRLNQLTQAAIRQIEEAVKLADVPVSLTGAGSMFRIHLREEAPQTYREAYRDKERQAVIDELLDYLFREEQLIMINTCACMFSTALTQKEVDRLSQGLYNGFMRIRPKILALNEV
jgi:glutamate-1-semialdehyde 2,1-aminomutase